MADVTSKVATIRNATYGNEVREGIASGIENINTEVISTTAKQTAQEIAYNSLIINAGNSNAEIVDARLGETTLKAKLQNVDSSLANKANKTDLAQGLNFKGNGTTTYIQTLTGVGVDVGDFWYSTDGKTNYAYNGTNWYNIGSDLARYDGILGVSIKNNLLDISLVQPNTSIESTVGVSTINSIWTATGYYCLPIIPVTGGKQYCFVSNGAIVDITKNKLVYGSDGIVTGVIASVNKIYTMPTGTAYFRASQNVLYPADLQFKEYSIDMSLQFEAYGAIYSESLEVINKEIGDVLISAKTYTDGSLVDYTKKSDLPLTETQEYAEINYISHTDSYEFLSDGSVVSTSQWQYSVYAVNEGDELKITGCSNGENYNGTQFYHPLYVFENSTGNVLAYYNTSTTVAVDVITDYQVTVPNGATKVYVNAQTGKPLYAKKLSMIYKIFETDLVADLQSKVNGNRDLHFTNLSNIDFIAGDYGEIFDYGLLTQGVKIIGESVLYSSWNNIVRHGRSLYNLTALTNNSTNIATLSLLNTLLDVYETKQLTIKAWKPIVNPTIQKNILFVGDSLTELNITLWTKFKDYLTTYGLTNYNMLPRLSQGGNAWENYYYSLAQIAEYNTTNNTELNATSRLWDDTKGDISFTKFMTDNNAGLSLDHINVLLGWNNVPGGLRGTTDLSTIETMARHFIETLHSDYPNCTVTFCGMQKTHPSIYENAIWKNGSPIDRNLMVCSLNELYESIANSYTYVRYVNVQPQFDSQNNMQLATEQLNLFNVDKTVEYCTDLVHPATYGFYQYAHAILASFFAIRQGL